jgi:hypothetical protein
MFVAFRYELVNFIRHVMLRTYDWNECALDLGFTLYTSSTWFSFNFWYTLEYFIKYLQRSLFDLVIQSEYLMGIVDLLELTRNRSQELMQLRSRCSALKERFFCKSRFGFLGFGFFGFVKQMERIVRIGIRLLFSRRFYNKFSVSLYLSVGSRYSTC